MRRRDFLRNTALVGMFTGMGAYPFGELMARGELLPLTILHTNDVHSRIDPFASGSKKGKGGAAKRAALIQQIRAQQANVLLLDAGDIFQGTPYFNFFFGELEYELMNKMGYDAATIGNHDFDAGMEVLANMSDKAKFPLLNANYDFKGTLMEDRVANYKIFNKGGIKVGVFGVGIKLEGLVPPHLFGKTDYKDPIAAANKTAELLADKGCDLVVCLSHLGYKYDNAPSKPSDVKLAAATSHIDLIIGGHTHTFMDEPDRVLNRDGEEVLVTQAGWAGMQLGRIDILFRKQAKPKKRKWKVTGKGIDIV